MNLNDIPNCPIGDEDLDALLRASFEAIARQGDGLTIEFTPSHEPPWVVYWWDSRPGYRADEHMFSAEGETLEGALESLFERLKSRDQKRAMDELQ